MTIDDQLIIYYNFYNKNFVLLLSLIIVSQEPLNFGYFKKNVQVIPVWIYDLLSFPLLRTLLNRIARWDPIVNERLHASQYNPIPYNSKVIRGRINNLTYQIYLRSQISFLLANYQKFEKFLYKREINV